MRRIVAVRYTYGTTTRARGERGVSDGINVRVSPDCSIVRSGASSFAMYVYLLPTAEVDALGDPSSDERLRFFERTHSVRT